MRPSLIILIKSKQASVFWAWSTLIILFGAKETDNNLLSSSTVNISNINLTDVQHDCNCPRAKTVARLLIMKLKITKSNYSPISSQKILCPELPSPRLYLSFSLPLPSFPSPSLRFLRFSLSPSSAGAAADRMTSPPRRWTAVCEDSTYTCVPVCMHEV